MRYAKWVEVIEEEATDLGADVFDVFFGLLDGFRAERAAYRFGGSAPEVPDVPPAAEIPFTTLSAHHPTVIAWFEDDEERERGVTPLVAALSAQPEWHRTWQRDYALGTALLVPVVDFASSMVVVVEAGSRRNGGYSVEITRVVEADGVLYVCATEHTVPHGSTVIMAATPLHVGDRPPLRRPASRRPALQVQLV